MPKIGRGVLLKTVRLDGLHAAEAVSDINGTYKTSNKDIRIGEEVFVFEQHSGGEWYRAYVVSSPSAMNILMDVLEHTDVVSDENVKPPDAKIITAVFPASCVKIKDYFEIKDSPNREQNNNSAYSLGKPFAPPVPALRLGIESPMLEGEPLVDDIISVIGEWNKVYLCRFFVNRNYGVVNELNAIIKELYVIRRQLLYQLLTEEETLLTRRRAIWLILKAKKMMSQGILVRDTVTGEILTGREDPVKLAKEQLLINLSPKYPNYNALDERSVQDVHLPTHISVKLVESDGQAGDGALTAFIYLRSRTKRLTEAFRISVDSSLVLSDLSTVLFTNIPAQTVKDEIYIVVVLSEEVPVSATSKKRVRRGIAAGVQSLSRIFQDFTHREKELTINMYASYSETGQYGQSNRGWGELVDRIIKGETVGVGKTPRADKVTLAVKDFQAPTASQLDFKANTAMFPATSLFVDSLIPKRDDLYVYLKTMTLAKGFDGADLISLNLQTAYGKVAFTKASNVEPVGGWFAASVYNGESIGEVVRVTDCGHGWNDTLYFNIFLGADFLGRGILQLWTNDRITSDGHKVIDIINSDRLKCATLEVSVDYVGNSFNVPAAIVTVNNWKKYFNSGLGDELMTACNAISQVPDPEFTLHFHRVVDNLCQIILAVDNEAYRDAAFGALIHALEVVSLKHHGNHAYLADDWLAHFSFVGIAKPLLAYIHKTKKVQKCGQYLANLIATAARVDIGVSEDKHAARKDLAVSLHHVIDDVVDAIKTDTPNKQTIALISHLPNWLENMRPLVGNRDCMETYIRFVDSIRPGNDKLTVAKLLFIQEMSRSWMFREAKYRARLASFTIRWTLPFITKVESGTITTFKKDLFRLVCAIFANQISILWPSRETEKGIIGMYVPLLPLFARTYVALLAHYKEFGRQRRTYTELFPSKYPFVTVPVDSRSDSKFDECLIEMGTIFMSIVTFANISGMSLPSSSLSRSELSEIILNILQACSAMLANQSFPKTWTSLVTLHHDTVFGTLTYLNSLLVEKFIPSPEQAEEFDASIWYTYLSTLLQVTGSDIIAIEFLSEQKRKAMWSLLGDIRGRASTMLQQTWDLLGWQASPEEQQKYGLSRLGGFQVNLYVGDTSLVVGILYMCLGKHAGAQAVAVNILKSMIVGEWILNNDLSQITREIIGGLDSVFQHKTFLPDEEDKNRFLQLLRQSLPDEVSSIAEDIEEFTDLLYDLHTIPAGDQYNDDRIFHTLNVLNFLRSLDKVEIFSRYVHDIAQWHVAKQNHVQAGLSLTLLSNAYSWDKTAMLGPSKFPKLPAQSEFARKEALLKDAIEYFDRADCLESSVDALKQLQVAYEQSYDFSKLSEITQLLARTYDKVDGLQRTKPLYFRVTLLGGGFPKSLRGRHFIFETSPFEQLESIHDILYRVHPKAVIIANENQARDEGQFLHVTAVQPMSTASHALSPAATDGAREYYDRQNMRLFSSTRASGPSENPTQMWTEKTIYETYQPFPTIVNRSEVKSIQVVKLSPAENALQTLNTKINELQAIESSFRVGGRGDTNLLPLVLEGAIDSGVGGGIHQYRVFIEDGDASIQQAFIEYAQVVKKCLAVHDRVMSPKMRQLHESLCERFRKGFAPELAIIGDDIAGARVAIKHPTGQF